MVATVTFVVVVATVTFVVVVATVTFVAVVATVTLVVVLVRILVIMGPISIVAMSITAIRVAVIVVVVMIRHVDALARIRAGWIVVIFIVVAPLIGRGNILRRRPCDNLGKERPYSHYGKADEILLHRTHPLFPIKPLYHKYS